MKKYSLLISIFILIIYSIPSFGQQTKLVSIKSYTQGEGLSSYYITKIIRDSYGFFWIGTQAGLNRFDGSKFLVINKQSPPARQIGGSLVSDIAEDKKRGFIWVAVSYGEICAIDIKTNTISKRITVDDKNKALSGKWLKSICLLNDTLWIGANDDLYAYDLKTGKYISFDFLNELAGHPALNVAKIVTDHFERIWLFCDNYGIIVLNASNLSIERIIPASEINFYNRGSKLLFTDCYISGDGYIYTATSWGVRAFFFDNQKIETRPHPTNMFFDSVEIFSCTGDRYNNLWMSDDKSLYAYNLRTKEYTKVSPENSNEDYWFKRLLQIFCDSSGNVWAGSQEGLASFSNTRKPFKYFYKSQYSNTKIKHAYCLLPYNDSVVYCGAADGLYKVNINSSEIKLIDAVNTCLMIYKDRNEKVFVSNAGGLFELRNNVLVKTGSNEILMKKMQDVLLNGALRYDDSLVYFSSFWQKGLYEWNSAIPRIEIYHNDTPRTRIKNLRMINRLFKSADNHFWVLSHNSVFQFNPLTKESKEFAIRKPGETGALNMLFDMCESKTSYWFAAYGRGIIETDKSFQFRRLITAKEGLCNDGVYKVFCYRDSLIIATSNNGMSVLNISTGKIKNYYQSDGLHSNAFEEFCGIQSNNLIYAGGLNGFTIIDPKYFSTNTVPPILYIDNIKAETTKGIIDTSNILLESLTIPNNVLQTTVSFSGINYSNPERTTYAYKIEPLQKDWINLNTQNFVNLIGLNPGTYTLEIKAANEDGIWSQPKKINLVFLPKWFQTIWFKILIAIAIASLVIGLYRYRISQLIKQQQIRRDIASDLHDDLGSTLNAIKIFAHMAIQVPQQTRQYLENVKDNLDTAIASLRDMIWILDDTLDSTEALINRLKVFYIPLTNAKNIEMDCTITREAGVYTFSKEEKRNLLLIAKEAINNSIKYSNCSNIILKFSGENKKLILEIMDDGDGFDMNENSQGYGLKNIQQRSKQINYDVYIISERDQGTQIKLVKK